MRWARRPGAQFPKKEGPPPPQRLRPGPAVLFSDPSGHSSGMGATTRPVRRSGVPGPQPHQHPHQTEETTVQTSHQTGVCPLGVRAPGYLCRQQHSTTPQVPMPQPLA